MSRRFSPKNILIVLTEPTISIYFTGLMTVTLRSTLAFSPLSVMVYVPVFTGLNLPISEPIIGRMAVSSLLFHVSSSLQSAGAVV